MKYIFVGDIHGKVEMVEAALAREGYKIFVGDFIDSWNRSVEDHKRCYDLFFDAAEKGEAKAIYGNHELSYFIPEHKCSGWDGKRDYLMQQYRNLIFKYFKPYILLQPDFLVSHAGLTLALWISHHMSLDNLPTLLDTWWPVSRSPIHWIGKYRGGLDPYGGLFWCDWNQEFQSVPGLTQVFGHTHTSWKGIQQRENSYCIDCLEDKPEFLELECSDEYLHCF